MSLKPITLWGHDSGSNAWKVAMVLEELSVPYTVKIIDFPDMKKEAYESINPNGRVPSIEDPNTGITLWESGAIIEYLVETYDKQNNFNFASGSKEYYEAKQWLYYQLPSVVDRYVNEIRRVSGVLNGVLQGKEFLVGGKYSYADASFVMWYAIAPLFADRINLATDFPALNVWLERIKARPAISKIIKDREAAMAASK
ncbi:hypothetical protein V499_07244 [Pseudogymnoascus sp. VKM F-103]|nr:hypothetical protein V499_07244 [Pseudogymnoascus sp. VKM F-103]